MRVFQYLLSIGLCYAVGAQVNAKPEEVERLPRCPVSTRYALQFGYPEHAQTVQVVRDGLYFPDEDGSKLTGTNIYFDKNSKRWYVSDFHRDHAPGKELTDENQRIPIFGEKGEIVAIAATRNGKVLVYPTKFPRSKTTSTYDLLATDSSFLEIEPHVASDDENMGTSFSTRKLQFSLGSAIPNEKGVLQSRLSLTWEPVEPKKTETVFTHNSDSLNLDCNGLKDLTQPGPAAQPADINMTR